VVVSPGKMTSEMLGINHELLRGTLVKVDITLRGVVEPDHSDVDCLGDLNLIVENGLHRLTMYFNTGV
jgi:hypothetical protein